MNDKSKIYCANCDCVVVALGHAERCRPKGTKGWSVERERAWIGDSIQRMDVQLAVQFLELPPSTWGDVIVRYTSNEAMAAYMWLMGAERTRSATALGTMFEASYEDDFRVQYLRHTFPAVCEQILAVWEPPALTASKRRVVAGITLV